MTSRSATPLASNETLFRFRVISEVLADQMRGESRSVAVSRAASRRHLELGGEPREVSKRTVYRWLAAYEMGGIAALEPTSRGRIETSARLSEELIDFIRTEKKSDPAVSTPELLKRAREHGALGVKEEVDRVTVWRAIIRMGLPTRLRTSKKDGDTRRFAYPHRMQMVLADGKHFRAGRSRAKRVALFCIDDSSRYALHVVVVPSESKESFLRCLFELFLRRGKMDIFYLDKGAGFIANDTSAVLAHLDVLLIHGATRYPEGHGKIERFNRTAWDSVLRGFDGAAEIDPDCSALERRLQHYLERYNADPHESLGGQSPRERWLADERALSLFENEVALREKFIVTETRLVSNDHVIQFGGGLYEAPRGLARQRVHVRRQVLSGELSLLHDGTIVTLKPVDLAANARSRRGSRSEPVAVEAAPIKTAATVAFDRDCGPLVDEDGGYSEPG